MPAETSASLAENELDHNGMQFPVLGVPTHFTSLRKTQQSLKIWGPKLGAGEL